MQDSSPMSTRAYGRERSDEVAGALSHDSKRGFGNGLREDDYARYLAALLAGDRAQCRKEFQARLDGGTELASIYDGLFRRSLYELGTLWEQGRVSVATEHLATAITEGLLSLAYPRLLNGPRLGKTAVVACIPGEYHQIGGRMVADFFELNGWRGHFLGANTPLKDLLSFLDERKPNVAVLSATMSAGLDSLIASAGAIRTQFPGLAVLVGGQVFSREGPRRVEQISNVRYPPGLGELGSWIKAEASHGK